MMVDRQIDRIFLACSVVFDNLIAITYRDKFDNDIAYHDNYQNLIAIKWNIDYPIQMKTFNPTISILSYSYSSFSSFSFILSLLKMSSLPDSSALSASESTPESSEPSRKGQKPTATTWLHSRSPRDDELMKKGRSNIFYCKYCENPPWSCQSTISARYHLWKRHNIELEAEERQIKGKSDKRLHDLYMKAGVQRKELEKEILKKVLDKQLINETLVSLIVL